MTVFIDVATERHGVCTVGHDNRTGVMGGCWSRDQDSKGRQGRDEHY